MPFVRQTEGTFDPDVDRVPAGPSVAPGGGPAPIPIPPRPPGRTREGPGATTPPEWTRSSSRRAAPAVLVAGTPPGAAQLDATGSVPGTFVATPAAGTIPGVGSGPGVTVRFTPAAATSTTTATAAVRIDVATARSGPTPGVPTVRPGGERARPTGPAATTGSGASGFLARPRERESSGSGDAGAEMTGPTRHLLAERCGVDQTSAFGADFEYQRHNIRAAVAAHIDTANVAGEMPYVGATSFHAEAYPW